MEKKKRRAESKKREIRAHHWRLFCKRHLHKSWSPVGYLVFVSGALGFCDILNGHQQKKKKKKKKKAAAGNDTQGPKAKGDPLISKRAPPPRGNSPFLFPFRGG
eukprot:FR739301.1.p3 GENE.FR739301.1~~FR739301.1.p3  ORF type:complete len:104 (+),score=49.49 FR739301.1:730-1041(+)